MGNPRFTVCKQCRVSRVACRRRRGGGGSVKEAFCDGDRPLWWWCPSVRRDGASVLSAYADPWICLARQVLPGFRVAVDPVIEFGEEVSMAMLRGDDGGPGRPIFGSSATSQLQRSCLPSKASCGAVAAARHRAVMAAGVVGI
jgi:hypothetical protein